MSDLVERFELSQLEEFDGEVYWAKMLLTTDGDWVRYTDIKLSQDRIEELEAELESLIEDKATLIVENEKLRKALELYERERARYRHAKPEITGAYFLAGGHGPKDDNQLPQFVEICPAYGAGWTKIYEDTGRTISLEGS